MINEAHYLHYSYFLLISISVILAVILSALWSQRKKQKEIPWLIGVSLTFTMSSLMGELKLDQTSLDAVMRIMRIQLLTNVLIMVLLLGLVQGILVYWRNWLSNAVSIALLGVFIGVVYWGGTAFPISIHQIELPWGERFSYTINTFTPIGLPFVILINFIFLLVEFVAALQLVKGINSEKARWLIIAMIGPQIVGIIGIYGTFHDVKIPIAPYAFLSFIVIMLVPVFKELSRSDSLLKSLVEKEAEREHLYKEVLFRKSELEAMLFTLSHDMRTPLINVSGFAHTIVESLMGDPHEFVNRRQELLKSCEFIRINVKRMDSVLTNVVELGRQSRDHLQLQRIAVKETLHGVVTEMNIPPEQMQIEVRDELVDCVADQERLSHIFRILLDNSFHFRCPERTSWVRISGIKKDSIVEYSFEDNGIGFSENQKDKIFGSFYKVDPKTPGPGMGLTTARLLLRRMGGSIWAEGQEKLGAKITISLPAA